MDVMRHALYYYKIWKFGHMYMCKEKPQGEDSHLQAKKKA